MGLICCKQNDIRDEVNEPVTIIEHQIQHILFKLTFGSIISESTDAILKFLPYSVDSVRTYIMSNIAGKSMVQQLTKQYRNKVNREYGDVLVCHAGELEFDYLFFAILPASYSTDADSVLSRLKSFGQESDDSIDYQQLRSSHQFDHKQYIQTSIHKSLRQCNELSLNSLSFPVIFSEDQTQSKVFTALLMLVTIQQYINEHHNQLKNINQVNITIADKEYLRPFKLGFNKLILGKHELIEHETPLLQPELEIDVRDSFDQYDNDEIMMMGKVYKKEDQQFKHSI